MTRERPLRESIIAATVELTASSGWSSVTMSRIAAVVGVSRQTVHNEVGTKEDLAEALVLSELERFLAVVEGAMTEHPDDIAVAIEAAIRGVLELAAENAVLRAIVSATHGAGTDLLPLLTTQSGSLLGVAQQVVAERASTFDLPLTQDELAIAVEVIVRVTLSHVMQPSGPPAETAQRLAWVASRVLRS